MFLTNRIEMLALLSWLVCWEQLEREHGRTSCGCHFSVPLGKHPSLPFRRMGGFLYNIPILTQFW